MTIVPTVSELIHHIKRCPSEFLKEPVYGNNGLIHTEALVNDIYRIISDDMVANCPIKLSSKKLSKEELSLIQICCWVLTHPFFKFTDNSWIKDFFCTGLKEISSLVKKEVWINDEERAEELARIIFRHCGFLPQGESREEALDRYESVNTIKRLQVIEESNAAMERAKAIRKKMEAKKAREAANVYGRE